MSQVWLVSAAPASDGHPPAPHPPASRLLPPSPWKEASSSLSAALVMGMEWTDPLLQDLDLPGGPGTLCFTPHKTEELGSCWDMLLFVVPPKKPSAGKWNDGMRHRRGKVELSDLSLCHFDIQKNLSRIKNILCFQVTLLLLGSQHNSFVFCPKSVGVRDPPHGGVGFAALSAHRAANPGGAAQSCQAPPAAGKPPGCSPPPRLLSGYRAPPRMQEGTRLTFTTCWARTEGLASSWPRSAAAICSQYCRAWAGSPWSTKREA